MFGRLTRRLIEAERPLLDAHDLSMWGYVVLGQLDRAPASSQLALAAAIGYDKTRLIRVLDDLEADRLIHRTPDRTDRRARIVALTPDGEARLAAARADVRAMEDDLLEVLDPGQRRALLAAVARLLRT